LAIGALALLAACKPGSDANGADAGVDGATVEVASASPASSAAPSDSAASPEFVATASASGKPTIGVRSFVTTVYREPRDTSRKLGYLRAGAKVARSEEPAGKAGCPGGWYQVEPRGYVCAGDDASIDPEDPMVRAATKRPNLKTALPYHYAFVRAVLPLYVRVPNEAEQFRSEFKLQEHLDWYKENEGSVTKVLLGANDIALDERGVAIPGKKIGELGIAKNSQEIGIGALLGGETDADPIPWWLADGKRAVPNIADYKVTETSVFADRARRHTGLALVASFSGGPTALNRRFAVTTDMRLAPATKIKPDTASPWHGVELGGELTLPLAFVRGHGARSYKVTKNKAIAAEELEHRAIFALTGRMKTAEGVKYYKTKDHGWLSQQDVGLAVAPATWPEDAEKGKKWIEIAIGAQTLVLWEGKKPVYATLISSGQAGIDDPKKTTATVRGVFRIRNKHITATMDSNERSSVGGGKPMAVASATNDDEKADARGAKGSKKKADKKDKEAPELDAHGKKIPTKGDGEYGVTKRRGEGTFQLRDVPYIQYFENGYALHAAYWHDVFGTPRSHGCVNLAPIDAHRIFFWTDPPVPDGWHAVNAGEDFGEGTLVIIHE
jgi:hypothetical protein